MRNYQRIIAGGMVLTGLAGLIGCDKDSNQASQAKKEDRLGYFTNRDFIKRPGGPEPRGGVGVVLGDMDGDGDLDVIVAYPEGICYFENRMPQKSQNQ